MPDHDVTDVPRYRDPALPVAARVADLLGRMTLEEKVGQLIGPFGADFVQDDEGALVDTAAGSMTHVLRASELPPREAARRLNVYQRRFVEETRLGIPALFSEEACCGPQVRGASMFPQPIALAASWDPDLITVIARTCARQLFTLGVRQALAPLCDVARDPRWGRLEESYGEDPYLAGTAAAAFVRGFQGPDSATGMLATLKHFIAYSETEGGRNGHPTHIGPRTLREIFGVPFEMAIAEAGAGAIMCSYNAIDQVPVQGSYELLTGLLREEYGFEGILVSDLHSVIHLHTRHHTAAGPREAGVQALRAGLDLEYATFGKHAFGPPLLEAVRDGEIAEAEIDRAVGRVLSWKFRLGLFERPYADEDAVPEVLETAEDRALARRAAARSIVLLHNPDGMLPLSPRAGTIAVIGPNADRPLAMLGDYAYATIQSAIHLRSASFDPDARGKQSGERTDSLPSRPDVLDQAEGQAKPSHASEDVLELAVETVPVVTLLQGIRAAAHADTEIRHARGCPVFAEDRAGFEEAVEIARASDVAIVAVGDQSSMGGIPAGDVATAGTVGEGIDSARCVLPGVQAELVEAIAATGTPVVLVLLHGRTFALGDLVDKVAAVVDAWFPGEEGGNAIADVLFGQVAPGGKSPVSYYRELGVVPAPYNRPYGADTYYDATLTPLFPFGHGLGYTRFEYRDLALSADILPTDGELVVSCTVVNSGERAGDEVIQLYARDPVARTVRPWIELKGFRRVHLAPGEAVRVSFSVAADRFALYDPTAGWIVEPGRIGLFVGASSQDLRLEGAVTLTGETRRIAAGRVLVTPAGATPA